MIHFQCETCGKRIRVEEEYAGVKSKCPSCNNALTIPGERYRLPKGKKWLKILLTIGLLVFGILVFVFTLLLSSCMGQMVNLGAWVLICFGLVKIWRRKKKKVETKE